ncbi:hypothetical protein [Pseudoxanthomonas sp.]|uniref:hypothetical protein n=1 Tax=Pseudoxanthomonas sp. TaxID=1871049 RepID=UPI0028C46973|nr:hypothetical protein [Pseudoxanthomonas sp.]
MTDTSVGRQGTGRRPVPFHLLGFLLFAPLLACAGPELIPGYSRDAVQPVVVHADAAGEARIRFVSPPETLYYAAGVSYRATGDALQVVIDRCPIHGDCTTMAKGTLLDDGRTTEVSVPIDGRRLVVLHTDGQQPLP